jgi:hypothetical protein
MAVVGTAACGGDLLGTVPDAGGADSVATTEIDASSARDAGSSEARAPDASSAPDGSNVDALGPACGGSWSMVFASYADSAGSVPVWTFDRLSDLLDFFRNLATIYDYVDPTTGMTCTTIETCPYDPRQPRVSPQDVHHSNALDEFIGPDGRSYVWTYYRDTNQWFAADAGLGPQQYQTIVDYNAGCLPNCACDAG